MRKLRIIILFSAVLPLLGGFILSEAIAFTEPVTGTVTIAGECEVVKSGNVNYGNTLTPLSGPGVEQPITLSNGGNQFSITSIFGTDWDDGTGAPAEMAVSQTHFNNTSTQGTYALKDALGTAGPPGSALEVITPQGSVLVNFQLDVALNPLTPSFTGTLTQTVTIFFTCVSPQ